MYKNCLNFFSILLIIIGIYLYNPFISDVYKIIIVEHIFLNPLFFLIGGILSLFVTNWRIYSLIVSAPLLYFSLEIILTSFDKYRIIPLESVILIPLAILSAIIAGRNCKVA